MHKICSTCKEDTKRWYEEDKASGLPKDEIAMRRLLYLFTIKLPLEGCTCGFE